MYSKYHQLVKPTLRCGIVATEWRQLASRWRYYSDLSVTHVTMVTNIQHVHYMTYGNKQPLVTNALQQ